MATAHKRAAPAASRSRELVITRMFDAPRELVWRAWTEPAHLSRWSCPDGFTITQCDGALRPGGPWRTCMHSAERGDLWVGGVYREIAAPERLVFTHAWDDETGRPGHETVVTVTLTDEGGKTKMVFRQAEFASTESRDGHAGGWAQCFEHLAEHLGRRLMVTLPSDRAIQMTRVFAAPRRLVFAAHSKPEHVREWWGPRRHRMVSCDMDFRPGGAWRYVLQGPDGREYAFRGEFREIVPPERIVWTFELEGAPGEVAVETLTLVERDGRTILTTVSVASSTEARDAMLQSGMQDGVAETWDRLEAYVAGMT